MNSILQNFGDLYLDKSGINQAFNPRINNTINDFAKNVNDSLLCKKTGLVVPSVNDYIKLCDKVVIPFFMQDHIKKNVDFGIYGSITSSLKNISENKLRPGLSDIDIIVLQKTSDLIVDISFVIEFEEKVVNYARKLGIPIQIKWYTLAQMQDPVFAADYTYLTAINKSLVEGYYSQGIKDLINIKHKTRDMFYDEGYMLRYFHDKIKNIGILLLKMQAILDKDKKELNLNDQKILIDIWDSFKKIISITSTSILSKSNEYIFSSSDKEIIKSFRKTFNDEGKNIDKLIHIFESINDIKDWYNFFKNKDGRCKILWQYYNNFLPFINAIGKKFNEKE